MLSLDSVLEKVRRSERIERDEALALLQSHDLQAIGQAADRVRKRKHPEPVVSYLIDRNINHTNVCVARCTFCNFYKRPRQEGGYVLSDQTIFEKIEETLAAGGTGILMQGGMNPDLKIEYYEELLRSIRKRYQIHLHCFSPPEIVVLAKVSKLTVRETVQRLIAAGLDSIPGGGAEILSDVRRKKVSPGKCSADEWLDVMKVAHEEGLKTTATMMFGGGESLEDRVEHLDRVRSLQDITGGFVAFIPWNVQLQGTEMEGDVHESVSPFEYLKTLAVSRIYLDNVPNIQVSWLTRGLELAQVALFYGANDVGSIMMEENVISKAGAHNTATQLDLIRLIENAGFVSAQRDSLFRRLPLTN